MNGSRKITQRMEGEDRSEAADSIAEMEEYGVGETSSRDWPQRDQQHQQDRQQQIVALYQALRSSLYAYLSTLGLTADEAEDVIQESFLRLMPLRTGELRTGEMREENLRGWLFRVAHNIAMDVHRSSWRGMQEMDESEGRSVSDLIVDPAPNPEQAYLHKEYRQRVYATLGELTEQQRNCILFRAEGLRYREIGSALDISFQRAAELVRLGLMRMTGEL